MRSLFFTLLASSIASFAQASQDAFLLYPTTAAKPQSLNEVNIDITYNQTLPCAACIRGGYLYCQETDKEVSKCCEPFDITCWKEIFTFKCMNTDWKDQYYSLFNWCGQVQAKATCGNSTITLDGIGNSTTINIDSLDYGESCTYGLISECGYPKIEINQTDVDVVVAYMRNSSLWRFNDPTFTFPQKWTDTLQKAGDKLQYVYGNWTAEGRDDTCGKNRTVLITITNLNKPTTSVEGGLVKANQVKNIGVTFSSVDGAFQNAMVGAFAMMMVIFAYMA